MRERPRLVAALLGAAVLLAGCAQPADRATPPSSSTTAPATSTADASITVPALSSSPASTPPSTSASEPAPSSTPEPPTSSSFEFIPVPESEAVTESVPEVEPEPAESEVGPDPEPEPEPEPEPGPEPSASSPRPQPAPSSPRAAPAPVADGTVVVIDPGHNGGNAGAPEIINQQVDAGFGQTKPCNTTGTSTNDGFTEASFTWAVAAELRPILEEAGIMVVMTRDGNGGVGPCVNERAAIGNEAGADAVVSIHGDGDEPWAQGYYVMVAERNPADAATAQASRALADEINGGLRDAGLVPSNHLGSDGFWPRGDLAGLNLSVRPTVMVEVGNMRNAADAAFMSSADGQQTVAQGLAEGVFAYLGQAG